MEAASTHESQVDGLPVVGMASSPGLAKSCMLLARSYVIETAPHVTRIREWMDEQYGLDDQRQIPPKSADAHD